LLAHLSVSLRDLGPLFDHLSSAVYVRFTALLSRVTIIVIKIGSTLFLLEPRACFVAHFTKLCDPDAFFRVLGLQHRRVWVFACNGRPQASLHLGLNDTILAVDVADSTISPVRVNVNIEVLAEALDMPNLELLHVDVTGVHPERHGAKLGAQILNRLHQVVVACEFVRPTIRLQTDVRLLA